MVVSAPYAPSLVEIHGGEALSPHIPRKLVVRLTPFQKNATQRFHESTSEKKRHTTNYEPTRDRQLPVTIVATCTRAPPKTAGRDAFKHSASAQNLWTRLEDQITNFKLKKKKKKKKKKKRKRKRKERKKRIGGLLASTATSFVPLVKIQCNDLSLLPSSTCLQPQKIKN